MIYGIKASNIGTYDIPNTKCNFCQSTRGQRVSIFGRYLHIFWIPLFPLGKKAVAECTDCKRTIKKKEFSPDLKQLYKETKSQVKRPLWHWMGLAIVGVFIALMAILLATVDGDARNELLNKDVTSMVSNPTMESDSISFKIKRSLDGFSNNTISASDSKFLTKIVDDKALILVQIPKLRKIEKEARNKVLHLVQEVTDAQEDLKGKKKFIGIQGAISMILIKTPTYEKNSRLALTSELLQFYGSEIKEEK